MPRGLLNAYAIKAPAIVGTIKDLIAIKNDPTIRLTATPFVHDFENKVFAGGAVPWKGVKGIEAVREIKPSVAEGLEKAISISKECRAYDEKGNLINPDNAGSVRVGDRYLPRKVLCQIEKAGS